MTQESKFAIIIGFAFLLVVGILVSDHLAEVARGTPASLAAQDPLAGSSSKAGPHIEYVPLVATRTPDRVTPPLPAEVGLKVPVHVVKRGETLSAISLRYYGDRGMADQLATYNGLPNPNSLTPTLRLLIPPRGEFASANQAPPHANDASGSSATSPMAESSDPAMAEYEVQSGDTLSELSQKLMGSVRHMNTLLSINKDRLSSADDLRVGTRLRYPTIASRSGVQSRP